MKQENNQSIEVKREIFEELSKDSRFQDLLKMVVESLKKGQEPTVIESFSTLLQKAKPNDELWKLMFTDADTEKIQKHWTFKDRVEIKVSLNAELPKPFQEARVSIKVKAENYSIKQAFHTGDDVMKYMVYFGYRDKNYIRLFFKSLGYQVQEGNVGDKFGLLISLGD